MTSFRLSSLVSSFALVALLLLAGPRTVEAQTSPRDRVGEATKVLETFIDTTHVPSISGAIAVDGEVVWADGFGYADLSHKVPATDETKYRIASISKPVTSTIAMMLVEEGRLDLDAPIRSYLPLFPEKRDEITTRQLLSHTAGIRHYRGDEFMSDTRYESRLGPVAIFADDSLLFEPGTDYSYSTFGYTLASAVIESAADSTFLELLEARLREPLNLNTLVPEKTEKVISNKASFYLVETANGDTRVVNAPFVDNSNKWTGGGLLSTPTDLVRWVLALLDGEILEPSSLDALFAPQPPNQDADSYYALGWRVGRDDQGRRRISHTGGAMGGSGVVMFYPDRQMVVATLANASDVPHSDLADRMMKVLLNGHETE